MTQAEAEFNATGTPARVFKDFRYRTRHSWTSERRVVGKAEFLDKGANPRFVVTSLSPERLGALCREALSDYPRNRDLERL